MRLRVRESAPRTMMPLCSRERERGHSEYTQRNGNQWSPVSPKSKTSTHTHADRQTDRQRDDDENHISADMQ